MPRGLLLLLALLVAALPAGLCVCGHEHEEQHECHCLDSPRLATLTASPDLPTDSPMSVPLAVAELLPAVPHVCRPVFVSESPPGYTSLPLYLSVGRLLI
jgi:hypothetical protein